MNKLFLYNSLTRKKEEFVPIKKDMVGLYTCGPTVYNYAHIGNLRSYVFEDILKRVLIYNGYKVKHVMNITDVGHMTGDMDMGEDKLEKQYSNMLYIQCKKCKKNTPTFIALTKEAFNTGEFINNAVDCISCGYENVYNKKDMFFIKDKKSTIWEIADHYTKAFNDDIKKLNILEPNIWCKATDYIKEQIDLIKILEAKGYIYKTSDGIYYDTSKFKDYNKLSHLALNQLKEGARVEKNPEKKNPTDFALWKFSPKDVKRQMEWDSPWGVGFPGWHIECSAMSLALLKDHLDIHCGGIDHVNVHHTNEIAQSEAATGKKFFNFWLHGAFLNVVGGKKMAKSAENFLTLENALIKKGINPIAFRFAVLQTHYRKPMEYSEVSIKAAQNGLEHLYNQVKELRITNYPPATQASSLALRAGELRIEDINIDFKNKFLEVVNDDLNTTQALAVAQEVLKSKIKDQEKLATILDFDKVLGLNLREALNVVELPAEVDKIVNERQKAREKKNFGKADELRKEIEKLGYTVEDTKDGQRVYKK